MYFGNTEWLSDPIGYALTPKHKLLPYSNATETEACLEIVLAGGPLGVQFLRCSGFQLFIV